MPRLGKRFITSYAIIDTGSTDGTQEVIRRELAGLPGQVVDRPWENFAVGRQQALELAQASGATFLMTLDADEQLVWPEGKPVPELTDDVYGIRFRLANSDSTWSRALILRAGLPWRWRGAVHEYLECEGHDPTRCMIENAYVLSHSDGARGRRPRRRYSVLDYLPGKPTLPPAKYRRDIEVLREQIAAEQKNPRAWFYLAQSFACNLEFDEAIAAYRHRATLGGDPEEIFYALYQVGGLLGLSDRPWTSRSGVPGGLPVLADARRVTLGARGPAQQPRSASRRAPLRAGRVRREAPQRPDHGGRSRVPVSSRRRGCGEPCAARAVRRSALDSRARRARQDMRDDDREALLRTSHT